MRQYSIDLEIVQGSGGEPRTDGSRPDFANEGICAWMYGCRHAVGSRFHYPDDAGRICPWLMDSLNGMIRVLNYGGTLPWRYQGTPYEKEIDPDGVTTEYVRCPDPTAAGIVVKIIRTAVPEKD